MPSQLIDPADLPTMTFDWGVIKPLVSQDNVSETPDVSLMHVVLLPGQGHERHNHPDADEILYVLAGAGDQMVDDRETFPARPGQAIWIPKGAFHSTVNTGWEPMVLLAIYAPAGAEQVLKTLPGLRRGPGGRRAAARAQLNGRGCLTPDMRRGARSDAYGRLPGSPALSSAIRSFASAGDRPYARWMTADRGRLVEESDRRRARTEEPPEEHAVAQPSEAIRLASAIGNHAFASVARAGAGTLRARTPERSVQRFVEGEHKLIGDLGSSRGPALPPTLELGPGLTVSYGDIVAMGGDWFESLQQMTDLAKVPGTGKGTREEVEYVLTVEIHGEKAREEDFSEEARKAAKARYYGLASSNPEHFLHPREGDTGRDIHDMAGAKEGGEPMGAAANYHDNHRNALLEAARAGNAGEPIDQALMLEAFSNHFLTDAFSGGHVRTPRQTVAEDWHAKVPMFFVNFKMFMAEQIAKYINDHNWRGVATVDLLMNKEETIALPAGALPTLEKTLAAKGMPPLTFGDIVGSALHDYDNVHGVDADVGGERVKLYGDSQLIKGGQVTPHGADTVRVAAEAVRTSLDEVEEAYESGTRVNGFLDRNGGVFAAELMVPQVAPELEQDRQQVRWKYDSVGELLADQGFKEAVAITAHDKAEELAGIGKELDEEYTREAFTEGFLKKLQGSPDQVVATLQQVIDYTPDTGGGIGGQAEDFNAREYFKEAKQRGALPTLSLVQKTRLVEHVLTGVTVGSEDAMIVELLDVNHDDGVKMIEKFGWHWIWDDVDGDDCRRFIQRLGDPFWRTQSLAKKTKEVCWLADGPTTEIQEETIIVILRTCSPADVRAIDKAAGGLDWDLDGAEQDEFDRLSAG